MERVYYKFGYRPVIEEKNDKGIRTYYSFQWESGEFKQDMTYLMKIRQDLSDEAEILTEEEFNTYVKELRSKL